MESKKINQEERIIKSISKKNKTSLEEKCKNYKGKNLAKEFSWDKPIGKEIIK